MENPELELQIQRIDSVIIVLRGRKVIIDADLARLYGVPTKRLNEQVKRNRDRFPEGFVLALAPDEKAELVAKCDRFKNLKHSNALPLAFTEFGAVMAANVLNSAEAIQTSVFVVRAFVKMREALSPSAEFRTELARFERRLDDHDEALHDIVEAIRSLTRPEPCPARRIGFDTE
jgi:hypothetical protein